jgi:predicted dehydrogenase
VNRRHSANRKTKELIDSGVIGDVVMVEANQSSGEGWDLTPDDFRWYGDDTGCPAGSLMTMGIHQADTLTYLLGPVTSVFSVFRKRHIPAPVDDVTCTLVEFESGVIGYLGSNFASPKTNWLRVYGTEGNIVRTVSSVDKRFDIERSRPIHQNTRLELVRKGRAEPEEVSFATSDPILEELDEFADCVRTGRAPETDGTTGLAALALIRAAIESAKTGKRINTADV